MRPDHALYRRKDSEPPLLPLLTLQHENALQPIVCTEGVGCELYYYTERREPRWPGAAERLLHRAHYKNNIKELPPGLLAGLVKTISASIITYESLEPKAPLQKVTHIYIATSWATLSPSLSAPGRACFSRSFPRSGRVRYNTLSTCLCVCVSVCKRVVITLTWALGHCREARACVHVCVCCDLRGRC